MCKHAEAHLSQLSFATGNMQRRWRISRGGVECTPKITSNHGDHKRQPTYPMKIFSLWRPGRWLRWGRKWCHTRTNEWGEGTEEDGEFLVECQRSSERIRDQQSTTPKACMPEASMTHYKSLISIHSTCKYATSLHVMLCCSIEKYFWNFKEHVTSPYVISHFSTKNIYLISLHKYKERHISRM
jgi:hypothetical protein